jgi:CheY-like chemotaxis protein
VARLVLAVTDLFFKARIVAAATAARAELVPLGQPDEAPAVLSKGADLVIVDLNATQFDPLALIRAIRACEQGKKIRIVGFLSHVQSELRAEAVSAGADEALPRSTFVAQLPLLVQGVTLHRGSHGRPPGR